MVINSANSSDVPLCSLNIYLEAANTVCHCLVQGLLSRGAICINAHACVMYARIMRPGNDNAKTMELRQNDIGTHAHTNIPPAKTKGLNKMIQQSGIDVEMKETVQLAE